MVDVGPKGLEDAACVGILQRKTALNPQEAKAHGNDLSGGEEGFGVDPRPRGAEGVYIGHRLSLNDKSVWQDGAFFDHDYAFLDGIE